MTLNYIGSKYKLIDTIVDIIEENIKIKGSTVGDLCSGTSICGMKFRQKGAKCVVSNDTEYYAYVIAKACVETIYSPEIDSELEKLNKLPPVKGLVYQNYAPMMGGRMYFTDENAMKIDAIRQALKPENKYFYYLLACLLVASDRVANVASVYGSFLKNFKSTSEKELVLKPIHTITKKTNSIVLQTDIREIKEKMDIAYIDPPYNHRQYSKIITF